MKWSRGSPGTSGIHRFACLSLYRALLRQYQKLPLTNAETNGIRQLVRAKFDRYRGLYSPTQTLHCLQAGYEALDLFHSASESRDAVARIQKLLQLSKSRTPTRIPKIDKIITPANLTRRQKQRAENIEFQRRTRFTHPDAEPILSRPRPVVPGRRKVPVFVNARGVPFLRIKKPQPQILTQVIRRKLEYKEKLIARRDRLLAECFFAKDEEDWDRLLRGESITDATQWLREPLWLEGSWPEAAWASYSQSIIDNRKYDRKNLDMARKMWRVVLAEQELADREEAERNKKTAKDNVDSESVDLKVGL